MLIFLYRFNAIFSVSGHISFLLLFFFFISRYCVSWGFLLILLLILLLVLLVLFLNLLSVKSMQFLMLASPLQLSFNILLRDIVFRMQWHVLSFDFMIYDSGFRVSLLSHLRTARSIRESVQVIILLIIFLMYTEVSHYSLLIFQLFLLLVTCSHLFCSNSSEVLCIHLCWKTYESISSP